MSAELRKMPNLAPMSEKEAAEVGQMYLEGDAALGVDLGKARKLLQEFPDGEWKQRWGGDAPSGYRVLSNAFMVIGFLALVAGIAASFLYWKWYWGLLGAPFLVWISLVFHGYPHPHVLSWLLVTAVFIIIGALAWHWLIPFALVSLGILSKHSMYLSVGHAVRLYAARNPAALLEWLRRGFMAVER